MLEYYKLIRFIQKPEIKRIIKKIILNSYNQLIIIFGSNAKNTEEKSNDIELYIESENKKLKDTIQQISSKLSIKIGKLKNPLLKNEIIKNHMILQNIERFYQIIK